MQNYTGKAFDDARRDWDSGLQVLSSTSKPLNVCILTKIADNAE
jgi:hypothetical protein